MKFLFLDKTLFETQKILEILETKCVPYKLHPIYATNGFEKIIMGYKIEVDVSLEYFDYLTALAKSKIYPYYIAEKSFKMPDAEKEDVPKANSITRILNILGKY